MAETYAASQLGGVTTAPAGARARRSTRPRRCRPRLTRLRTSISRRASFRSRAATIRTFELRRRAQSDRARSCRRPPSRTCCPAKNLNNPHDNLAIHNRIMDDYKRRWPGDPARQAVAYFSGPGNVAPPGSATSVETQCQRRQRERVEVRSGCDACGRRQGWIPVAGVNRRPGLRLRRRGASATRSLR